MSDEAEEKPEAEPHPFMPALDLMALPSLDMATYRPLQPECFTAAELEAALANELRTKGQT